MKPDPDFDRRLSDALKRNNLDLSEEDGGHVNVSNEDDSAEANAGLANGMRIGIEFMAGTVVGLAIGYGVDSYFNSSPWGLLIFTILGFCAGLLNVYRSVNNIEEGIGINRGNGQQKK